MKKGTYTSLAEEIKNMTSKWAERIIKMQHDIVKNYLVSMGESPDKTSKKELKKKLDKYNIRLLHIHGTNTQMIWAEKEMLFKIDYEKMIYTYNPKYYEEEKS